MASTSLTPAALAAERIAQAICDSAGGGVDPRHWEQALFTPLREFLNRPGKEFRGGLVSVAWLLGGGAPGAMPEQLPVALELLHAGSLIIDDIQDGSETRRGRPALHRLHGVPVALNAGNWLYFGCASLVDEVDADGDCKLALLRRFRHAVLRCHHGQALDLTARVSGLDPGELRAVVSASTALKTGSLVELATFLGARAAGATPEVIEHLRRFAQALGAALQALDDLGGVLADARCDKGDEDLCQGRPTWVWVLVAEAVPLDTLVELQAESAAVERGADPGVLRGRLRASLPANARACVSRDLDDAYAVLLRALGPSAGMTTLAAEVERLGRSYG